MANALDRPDLVPWENLEAFYDYRLAATGMNWDQFVESTDVHFAKPEFRKYQKTGFATPSGKVELKSGILEDLGFDPLPYFREDPPEDPMYPLKLFTGVREDGFFQTGHRHIPEMRQRHPEPILFVSPGTARTYDLTEDEWVEVANGLGRISIKVSIRDSMPDGLVRIPHGWWKPEMQQGAGHLSGALKYADAQLCRDDEEYLDREQGIPHLKGVPCQIYKVTPRAGSSHAEKTDEAVTA
jgi:anaerobic selenocysteine-containing dehydrogenase